MNSSGDTNSTYWEKWHSNNNAQDDDDVHINTLKMFVDRLPGSGRVLELGCGQGYDAVKLGQLGYTVTATDLSRSAILQANELASAKTVKKPPMFQCMNTAATPYPWRNNSFDGVFAYLSLHYFDEATTRAIISEIGRVIAPEGTFVFMVRSTQDTLYGSGEPKGDHMYELRGHLRRFFSSSELYQLLSSWDVDSIEQVTAHYLNPKHEGTYLRAMAHRA
ncbi:class I SAM-dependent methyltransferase [Amycolatopsis sp. NPDC049252]|uniref:class I SAM-dependent methyltransferase n=1 Tax=Amycolatopsis sp. NPDC049252 TaxID=3363933 RepID=UPI0037218ACE